MRRTPANLRSESRGKLSVVLNRGLRLLPKQEEILTSDAFMRAALGSWGSGKTTSAVLALLRCIFLNPYDSDLYGEDRPMSIVCGLSMRVLKASAWREVKRIVPPELILREWKAPDPAIEFANGHLLSAYSVKGSMEGASVCGVLVDEIHLLPDDKTWLNYQARAREPRAAPGSHLAIMSGIPIDNGWLRQLVDRPDDPNRLAVYSTMAENHYLPDHVAEEMRKSVSEADADTYLHAKWRKMTGLCFHSFDESVHVISRTGDRGRVTHLSVDLGVRGCILFGQEIEVPIKVRGRIEGVTGLLIVDEMLPDSVTLKQAMREAKGRGWRIDPRESVICVDPTARSDELSSIRSVFGDKIRIIRRKRGDVREQVEYGIDCVNVGLRSSEGVSRIFFAHTLPRDKMSIRTAVNQYARNPRTGTPVKTNTTDHAADCLRMLAVQFLPLRRGGHRVLDRRA